MVLKIIEMEIEFASLIFSPLFLTHSTCYLIRCEFYDGKFHMYTYTHTRFLSYMPTLFSLYGTFTRQLKKSMTHLEMFVQHEKD